MKVIYIAGKYRDGRGEWWIRENIRRAEAAAEFVWQNGGAALCPHKNTGFFGGLPGCTDETWLAGDVEMLRRCDAVWAIEGWGESSGAMGEVDCAKKWGIPVFFCKRDVLEYLSKI